MPQSTNEPYIINLTKSTGSNLTSEESIVNFDLSLIGNNTFKTGFGFTIPFLTSEFDTKPHGLIKLVSSNLNVDGENNTDTFDFKLSCKHKNTLTERFIFSPGLHTSDDDNKFILNNTIANNTGDDSRKSKIIFRGVDPSDNDSTTDLALIEASHSGTQADSKGKIVFSVTMRYSPPDL